MENYTQTTQTPEGIPAGCTKKEYRKNYTSAQMKKNLKTWSIFAYVLVGVNVLLAVFVDWTILLDAAILLGLTLGVHVGKSKGCAIALLVYSILSCLIALIMNGSPSGWWWIVLAVSYITTFKKIDEEYANWSKAQTDAYSSDYTF